MMDLDYLLNDVLEEYLLECVSEKIEEISELPKMLKDINYLKNKQEFLNKTTECEILDVDENFVDDYCVSGNEIHIQYELSFILQTFIDSEFIWRVQGCARSELTIPDTNSMDWSVFDPQDDNFSDDYDKFRELVHFQKISYQEMECDTLYVMPGISK